MGDAPNDTEMRMFFILTLGMVIFGLFIGAAGSEFLWGDIDTVSPSTAGGFTASLTILSGLASMFTPLLGIIYLPVWLLIPITLVQIFWYYLLYAVVIRPLIPFT
jgi:hypothetical protein